MEAGFWRSSDPVTPEEVFAYWREPWEMYWAEQPFTVTPEYVARWIERKFSPSGPSANAFRYITASPDVHDHEPHRDGRGVSDRRAARQRLLGVDRGRVLRRRAPLTAMGKLDHAFFEDRQGASNHA